MPWTTRHRLLAPMRSTRRGTSLIAGTLLAALAGCGAPAPDEAPSGVWGDATIAEDLAIGVETGADEYMLGSVRSVAVADDGTMYVVDSQVPIIRAYDRDGTFLRDVGRQGEGPGEYSRTPAVRVMPHGELAVWDLGTSRISFFSEQGELLGGFPATAGSFGGHRAFFTDVDENLYLLTMKPGARSELDQRLVKYTIEGEEIDSIDLPPRDPEGRGFGLSAEGVSAPQVVTVSTWSPLGYVVTGRNDAYDIELRKPEGALHLRRDLEPAAVGPEEQGEWEAFRQSIIQRSRSQGIDPQYDPDSVPDTKPFFRDIQVGEDGRVWVWRYVAAEKRDDVEPLPDRPERPLLTWREPWTYDVFEPDGTFLGSVVVPELFQPLVLHGDRIWGSLTDEDGVERVVRLRVVPEADR